MNTNFTAKPISFIDYNTCVANPILTIDNNLLNSITFFNGEIVLTPEKAMLYGEEIKDMGVLYNEMLKLIKG